MKKVIILNAETTGLDSTKDEILQLTILSASGKILFNEYFLPSRHTEWPDAEAIHHISYERVRNCRPMLYYEKQIQDIIDDTDIIVGYNHSFDMAFLEAAGIHSDPRKNYDLMLEFSQLRGEWDSTNNRYKWFKLRECAEYFGYHMESNPDCLSDCKAILYCYRKILSGETGEGGTVNHNQFKSAYQSTVKISAPLIMIAILMTIAVVFIGLFSRGESQEEKIAEKAGITNDHYYREYLELKDTGKLDNDNKFITGINSNLDGFVHVTFATNSLMDITYYRDENKTKAIDPSGDYMHPGEKIYGRATPKGLTNNLQYHLSELRIVDYTSSAISKNIPAEKDTDFEITIPDGVSEIGIIPVGRFDNRILNFRAYSINTTNEKQNIGQWKVNNASCKDTAEIPPDEDYSVTYDYSNYASTYYCDENDIEPTPQNIDESKHIVFFKKVSVWDESPVTSFTVKLRPYIDLEIKDGQPKNLINNITDQFNKQTIVDSIQVNDSPIALNDSKDNDTIIKISQLKCGDEVVIKLNKNFQLINDTASEQIIELTEPVSLRFPGSYNYDVYTIKIPDEITEPLKLYVKGNNTDSDKVYHTPAFEHAIIELYYKFPEGLKILDGMKVPNESEDVVLIIRPESEDYYLSGIKLGNDGIYRGEMSYSRFESNLKTLLGKLNVGRYIKITLPTKCKYGTCTYKLEKQNVSGEVLVKENQTLEIKYTINKDSTVKVINGKGKPVSSASKDLEITPDMHGTVLNPDKIFKFEK